MAKLSARSRTELARYERPRQSATGETVTDVMILMSDGRVLGKTKAPDWSTKWAVQWGGRTTFSTAPEGLALCTQHFESVGYRRV